MPRLCDSTKVGCHVKSDDARMVIHIHPFTRFRGVCAPSSVVEPILQFLKISSLLLMALCPRPQRQASKVVRRGKQHTNQAM